jgi:hypothetical protein
VPFKFNLRRYTLVASVTVSYPETSFRLEGTSALPEGGLTGFGQLHPRSQGIRTLVGLNKCVCVCVCVWNYKDVVSDI